MSTSGNLQAALNYNGLGWSVFPLKPGTKEPPCKLLPKKRDYAELFPGLTDEEANRPTWKPYEFEQASETQIRVWWTKEPDAGIALVLGQISGVVALDFDGDGAGELLRVSGLGHPATAISQTGGGGQHVFFRCDDDLPSIARLVEGDNCHVEFRAAGNYVVLPSSVHPLGKRYEWLSPPEEICDLPDNIRKAAQRHKSKREGAAAPVPEKIAEGSRNTQLTSIAGTLRRRDLPQATIEKMLLAANDEQCEPPLPEEEVRTIADSVSRYTPGEAGAADQAGEEASQPKQAELLVRMAEDECTQLFTDQVGDPFVRLPVNSHQEIWSVGSRQFKRWLSTEFRSREERPPSNNAISEALLSIEGVCAQGNSYELYNRVAWHDDSLYYDLSDGDWRAVKVSATGWEIVADPPVLFRRYAHQQPQVTPTSGGDVERLLDFINIHDDALLFLVYVVSCFIPGIPHPILVVDGPQGSTKSSICRTVHTVVDPSVTPVLSFPQNQAEAVQQLQHNWLCLYDNVSSMPLWLSDLLCRASTGHRCGPARGHQHG